MDFSAKLENLQAKVNETVETARSRRGEPRPTQAARRSGTRRGESGHGGRQAASCGDRRSSQEQVGADEG